MKTDLFQACGHCWVFQICWHIECSTFTASSFRIWNSLTGIPSPALALFIVMLSKAHLTSHSRMSGSRWVADLQYYIDFRSTTQWFNIFLFPFKVVTKSWLYSRAVWCVLIAGPFCTPRFASVNPTPLRAARPSLSRFVAAGLLSMSTSGSLFQFGLCIRSYNVLDPTCKWYHTVFHWANAV